MTRSNSSLARLISPLALAAAALASGCAAPPAHEHGAGGMGGMEGMGHMASMAVATLTPIAGSNVRGIVMFHEKDGHLMVHAKLSGLAPGVHGFHLHDKGDCASPDGMSAGGHFNPTGQPHGPQTGPHHAGDIPALTADASGNVDEHFMLDGPTVAAGPTSVIGHSVIVHANPDDYATQPTGNSGGRVACGVIAGH